MLRILPQELVNAYKGKGIVPVAGSILCTRGGQVYGACGLGAIAYKPGDYEIGAALLDMPAGWKNLYERMDERYGLDYTNGFITGFDGHHKREDESERYYEGYEDGQRGYQAAKAAFQQA